mgnify:CR=1 FL=1
MKRIMTPLASMGADITSKRGNGCVPLLIHGKELHAVHYDSPVASAQVKSCVLLAGMYADGVTSVTEPFLSRNHTEIMLNYFGADITSEGTTASIKPEPVLEGREVQVPGDISSAAYFIAAGLLTPGSEILLKNVGINPTRAGILKVCMDMGADITLLNESTEGEPTADLLIRTSGEQRLSNFLLWQLAYSEFYFVAEVLGCVGNLVGNATLGGFDNHCDSAFCSEASVCL